MLLFLRRFPDVDNLDPDTARRSIAHKLRLLDSVIYRVCGVALAGSQDLYILLLSVDVRVILFKIPELPIPQEVLRAANLALLFGQG